VVALQLSNNLMSMIRVRVINPVAKEIRLSERLKVDYTWQENLDLSELPNEMTCITWSLP
jgi:hypothetical protein